MIMQERQKVIEGERREREKNTFSPSTRFQRYMVYQ